MKPKERNILKKQVTNLLSIVLIFLFVGSYSNVSYADETKEYKKINNQVLVSPHNMEGQANWYVCVTNCEAWGLEKGQWHRHLESFQFIGHVPTAPVEVFKTDEKGEITEKIETINPEPNLEPKTPIVKEEPKEEVVEEPEIKAPMLSEEELFEKGKQDGYKNYRYGGEKSYLQGDSNYHDYTLYQNGYNEGWDKAQSDYYEKYPFLFLLDIRIGFLNIFHMSGIVLLFVFLLVWKARKAKREKDAEKIYRG